MVTVGPKSKYDKKKKKTEVPVKKMKPKGALKFLIAYSGSYSMKI